MIIICLSTFIWFQVLFPNIYNFQKNRAVRLIDKILTTRIALSWPRSNGNERMTPELESQQRLQLVPSFFLWHRGLMGCRQHIPNSVVCSDLLLKAYLENTCNIKIYFFFQKYVSSEETFCISRFPYKDILVWIIYYFWGIDVKCRNGCRSFCNVVHDRMPILLFPFDHIIELTVG